MSVRAHGKRTAKLGIFRVYPKRTARIGIWQDRSGVTRKENYDIGLRERCGGDIVVVGGRCSYVASTWCIGAGVLT